MQKRAKSSEPLITHPVVAQNIFVHLIARLVMYAIGVALVSLVDWLTGHITTVFFLVMLASSVVFPIAALLVSGWRIRRARANDATTKPRSNFIYLLGRTLLSTVAIEGLAVMAMYGGGARLIVGFPNVFDIVIGILMLLLAYRLFGVGRKLSDFVSDLDHGLIRIIAEPRGSGLT
jgi:hypothetical protein